MKLGNPIRWLAPWGCVLLALLGGCASPGEFELRVELEPEGNRLVHIDCVPAASVRVTNESRGPLDIGLYDADSVQLDSVVLPRGGSHTWQLAAGRSSLWIQGQAMSGRFALSAWSGGELQVAVWEL